MACGAGLSASSEMRKARRVRASRRKAYKSEAPRVPDIEKRLAETLKREAEAQEQQAATAEILSVISSSPTKVQPVFDAILRSAVRLCDGFYSALFLVDGQMLHFRANHNLSPQGLEAMKTVYPLSVRDGSTGAVRW